MRKTILAVVTVVATLLMTVVQSTEARAFPKGRYRVVAAGVYVRNTPQGYCLGRLEQNQLMDVQFVSPNGWAYGFAEGNVNRAVWAQFFGRYTKNGPIRYNFTRKPVYARRVPSPTDPGKEHRLYVPESEWTNGEINNRNAKDGTHTSLSAAGSDVWENWDHNGHWGNHKYRGRLGPYAKVRFRYTTPDGKGAMVRIEGTEEWVFVLREHVVWPPH